MPGVLDSARGSGHEFPVCLNVGNDVSILGKHILTWSPLHEVGNGGKAHLPKGGCALAQGLLTAAALAEELVVGHERHKVSVVVWVMMMMTVVMMMMMQQ